MTKKKLLLIFGGAAIVTILAATNEFFAYASFILIFFGVATYLKYRD